MNSQFGGIPVSAPTTSGGSKFGGIPVAPAQSAAPAAAPAADPNMAPSAAGQALDTYVGDVSGAWGQLKNDFIAAGGGTKEEHQAWGQAPFWDQMKTQFDRFVAAGRLPEDAFNAVVTPLISAPIHATAGKLYGAGLHAALPGSEQLEQQGKLPQADQILPNSLAYAMPEKGFVGAPTTGPRSTFSHIMTRPFTSPEEFAHRYYHRALTREGVTLDQAKAAASKPGASLSDVGGNATIEAGEQAALSGEGRRLGAKLYYDERMKGREARVAQTVDQIVSDKNMYETMDTLNKQRQGAAEPLYKEAFSGGSHAALKTQFENEFSAASSAAQKARQAASDADNAITLAHAKYPETDNVYGASARNQALKKAASNKAAAELKLAKAEADKQGALDRLRTAQQHEEQGVKGGMWSPRLQQFLDDPIFRPGISRGLEIQRLNALEKGEQFNPHEYGITGYDQAGEPVVSKVPNLRLLDAAKRGLDAILEDYRSKDTGKLVLDTRGRAIEGVRKAYVEELDRLTADNPAYKKAREAWSGPSRMLDAMHMGRDFHKMDPEEIEKTVGGLSADEHESYKIGVARSLSDQVTNGANGAISTAKRISGSTAMKARLQAALKDPEAAKRIIEMAEREVEYQQRGSQILGGSPTARRAEGTKEFEQIGPVLDELIAGARNGITGVMASGGRQLSRLATGWLENSIRGLSQARRDALAKLLFSTDKEDNIRALELLYDEGTVTTPGMPISKATLPAAAAAGQNNSQQSLQ